MAYSSMELTIRELKKRKWDYGIVERFVNNRIPHRIGIRSDLFHIFDLVVMSEDSIIGIQTCKNSMKSHYDKMTVDYRTNTLKWLLRGGKAEIWNWSLKLKKRGGKKRIWVPTIREILPRDCLTRK